MNEKDSTEWKSSLYGLLLAVFGPVLRNAQEARTEDRERFDRLMKIVNPSSVLLLHERLSGNQLLSWQIDMFQDIDDFYSLPTSRFHSRGLQRRSKRFEIAHNNLMEFTRTNFYPNPGLPDVFNMSWGRGPMEVEEERIRILEQLSLAFGRAHFKLFEYGKRKGLYASEWLLLILVIAVATVAVVVALATFIRPF